MIYFKFGIQFHLNKIDSARLTEFVIINLIYLQLNMDNLDKRLKIVTLIN